MVCDSNLEYSAYSGHSGGLVDSLVELGEYENEKKVRWVTRYGSLYSDALENALYQWDVPYVPIGKYYYNDKENNNKITEGSGR